MLFMVKKWLGLCVCVSAVLAWLIVAPACSSLQFGPTEPTKEDELAQYWLTISLYAGPFYDDLGLTLIDYRPFSVIDDVKTPDGHIIRPPKEVKIIPAGTLIKLVKISYPDEKNIFKRPIYWPKNNILVYVKVAKDRGLVTLFREETHVMILPASLSEEAQVKTYLSRFFSTKDPNLWILQTESYIQDGIFTKTPKIGMRKEQVIASLGPAQKKQYQAENDFEPAQEIWRYHDYLIVFVDNKVNKITRI